MTDVPGDNIAELRQRLEELDDAFAVRALAVLDVAEELHRQANERIDSIAATADRSATALEQLSQRIDRIGIQIDRNALAIAQLTISVQQSRSDIDTLTQRMFQLTGDISDLKQLQANSIRQADTDRAIMLQLLRVMAGQQPNGKGENSDP
jgi:chromosome segregation ATPase